jgi:hypothetical protein
MELALQVDPVAVAERIAVQVEVLRAVKEALAELLLQHVAHLAAAVAPAAPAEMRRAPEAQPVRVVRLVMELSTRSIFPERMNSIWQPVAPAVD